MNKKFKLSSPQIILLSFLIVILIGTVLLLLPFSTTGENINFIDALFTATSATCVTGLIVHNTGTYFTRIGQMIILLMMQVGGLGIMTFSSIFLILLKQRISIKDRLILQENFGQKTSQKQISVLIRNIVIFTIITETVGALLLYLGFRKDLPPSEALYSSIFHSISAFCNAGFSIYQNSFSKYVDNPLINFTVISLIIIGGLGFFVLTDLQIKFFRKFKRKNVFLTLHTKIVLTTSLILIIVGALLIYLFECTNILAGFNLRTLFASLFQSVTTRTAGFNTIDIGKLQGTTLFLMIILMFIGASPGSTGGGIKTTTFVVVLYYFFSVITNKQRVVIRKRTIPREVISKSIVIFFISCSILIFFTMLLQLFQSSAYSGAVAKNKFLEYLFEVTSAFCTVGLSTGVTPNLTSLSRLLITVLMYIGRLGPLTIAVAFTQKERINIEYPDENILIG
ncbi:MAG: Trk family potassium uptake protein [Candidatus Cloacimonadota bacterium]|nr:MAG: Trk family potassium uptake protein [Candidatus Cloacimonadota bacterium]